ncbi:hypothetical protein COO60DRAFT_1663 [Scenedesmus sp. NREL 46B-D3]|nr:hypothetical protein COO60DRAFT_1663 [Scenedesmus sp. NREL 46B-D3]
MTMMMKLLVLEDARYDKIAAVRVAAAAALVKFSALPDPPQPVAAAAPAAPDTPSAAGGCRHGSSSRFSSKDSTAKQRPQQSTGIKTWQAHGARSDSAAQHRFMRPKVPAGAVLDYGIQVFAPPSPQRHTPTRSRRSLPMAEVTLRLRQGLTRHPHGASWTLAQLAANPLAPAHRGCSHLLMQHHKPARHVAQHTSHTQCSRRRQACTCIPSAWREACRGHPTQQQALASCTRMTHCR